jgi:hypothetical protein
VLASLSVRFDRLHLREGRSMKNLARILAFTTLALIPLTPVTSASAAVAILNVEPETMNRITAGDTCEPVATDDCIHVLTATVTDAGVAQNGVDVSFEFEGGPSDPDPADDPLLVPDAECTTAATPTPGTCQISFHSMAEGTDPVRAWIEDGTLPFGDEADAAEGRDEVVTAGATEPDQTDVVDVTWLDGVLNIEPEVKASTTSTEVKFEATVLEKDPATGQTAKPLVANVDAEILAGSPNANVQATNVDMECDTLPTTGKCELKYTAGATTGEDTIRGWVDRNDNAARTTPKKGDETTGAAAVYEADDTETATTEGTNTTAAPLTDVVKATLSPNPQLLATPENQTKQTGETAVITAALTIGGTPENAKRISAVVLSGGPNAGKALFCNTGSGGTCTLEYTGTGSGTDKVRLWADTNSNGQPDEADVGEDQGTAGTTPEPDTTEVVAVTWQSAAPPPPPDPDDNDACEQATKDLQRAKKKLKKAKAGDNERKIKKAKKRVKRARRNKQAACA